LIGRHEQSQGPKKASEGVTVFTPRPEELRDTVRRLAANTANIKWSEHALSRMTERGILDVTAVQVLRYGAIKGAIEPGSRPGEWKLKMVDRAKGRRDVGVVVIVIRNAQLLVNTVEWEDL